MEKIILTGENLDTIELFVLESTRLAGVDYILASDVEEGDGECYVLKDVAPENSEEAVYEPVTDENELDYIISVFAEQMDDVDIDTGTLKS